MTFGFGVGIQRLGSVGVDTQATLLATGSPGATLRPTGYVYADPDPTKNGVYTWTGSAWVRQRGLPEQLATLTVTGGTANAIIATADTGVDLGQAVAVFITPTSTNTGAVTINGIDVVDASGNALGASQFVAGQGYFLQKVAGQYRVAIGTFASAAQGAKADSALQPSAIGVSVASATQGARADTVFSALPTATGNVQGTGIPGINGGHFFAYNAPSTFDNVPTMRIDRSVLSATGAGTLGSTYKALWVLGYTNPSSPGYEWTGTFEQHNRTSGTAGAENVALNATVFLESNSISPIGKTWGSNFVVDDREAVVNPGYSRIGSEIDNFCLNTGGTDTSRNRVVLQLAFGATNGNPSAGSPLHFGRGILFGSNTSNTILDRLIEVSGAGSYGIGLDTSGATFSGPVLFMTGGQRIAFDGNTSGVFNRSMFYSSGSLAYESQNGVVFSLNDAGNLTLTGTISCFGNKVVGARSTGWADMTGASNKASVFDVNSVTLPQLAARVAAIQIALSGHGLIGA